MIAEFAQDIGKSKNPAAQSMSVEPSIQMIIFIELLGKVLAEEWLAHHSELDPPRSD